MNMFSKCNKGKHHKFLRPRFNNNTHAKSIFLRFEFFGHTCCTCKSIFKTQMLHVYSYYLNTNVMCMTSMFKQYPTSVFKQYEPLKKITWLWLPIVAWKNCDEKPFLLEKDFHEHQTNIIPSSNRPNYKLKIFHNTKFI